MGLFQHSVLNKYLKGLDKEKVSGAYEKYIEHFHNPIIQDNIRNSKEEQYQGGFFIDLFVNILGFVKNPTPLFNLTTELKDIKGSKKTDGAILKDRKAFAVIELKGANTTDLGKVELQAFGYKNNHPGCNYVITSNFEKLRFYIDNAVDFEEFNLFQLSRDRFDILWLCISSEYLLKDIPKKIKEESLTQEENVTKKLYKDYSQFRNEIFDSIQKENTQYDKLTLFKKTQKLLDRFLFIFFAEDRLLLPPNSIRSIVNQWTDLRDKYDEYFPLYDRFKKYFQYMNTGHKGQHHEIFAYNGGLFAPDEILDHININDDILYKHTINLSNYDFESEVSVNILGHIFEHSLNDIEEIQAEIEGITTDKSKSKRKKDGVFYTPKYITKYIVDNTVGKLCTEKKVALDIQEEEYDKDRKNRQTTTLKKLGEKLEDYRKWLLNITICDPACGSGAFLNQALEFLINEHKYIDEMQAKLYGDTMILSEVENSILEHNLFGVDINDESVEIAKLSLWLRTAQKGRKLTSLNSNIKCGNSLIGDPAVAGDKAFHWQKEFPRVFHLKDKQAFHVVLTTHNSRTSQRMMALGIVKGDPIELGLEEEIALTEIIGDIIRESGYHCMSYNVCKDHVHLIMVCEAEELTGQIQKIKSISSKLFRRLDIPMGHDPLNHLGFWSQKFFRADLNVWSLAELSTKPGYLYGDTHLSNALTYIYHNREKHELPASTKLQKIIDSFVVDQDTAFTEEYKGGFDVVIGNPPYVRAELLGEYKDFFESWYKVYNTSGDLFSYFYEKSFNILKNPEGLLGFISNTFDKTTAGITLREYLSSEAKILKYLDFTEVQIFEGATTYPVIIIAQNKKEKTNEFQYIKIPKSSQALIIDIDFHDSIWVAQNSLKKENWSFKSKSEVTLITKLIENLTIREQYGKCYYGVKTALNEAFIIPKSYKISDHVKPILEGKELSKWISPNSVQQLILFESKWTKNNYGINIREDEALLQLNMDFPNLIKQILTFEERAKKRYDKGDFFWELRNCAYYDLFELPKIVFPNLQNKNKFSYDETGTYINAPAVILPTKDKFLVSILNSKIVWYFLTNICVVRSGGYIEVKPQYFEQIPIPQLTEFSKANLTKLTEIAINHTSELQKINTKFVDLLQSKYSIEKPSKKLQSWHTLSFGQFLEELHKQKVQLTLSEEAQWMQYFNEQKEKALAIEAEINKTDQEIDQMVYELYGLTDDEIKIVEQS